jgi:hypothetical protein
MNAAEIRNWERRLKVLERALGKVPTRGVIGGRGGGGSETETETTGRIVVPTVEELPAVPTVANTYQMVFWTSAGAGDGDDRVWWTYYGLTRWYPLVYTTLAGTPGSEELD